MQRPEWRTNIHGILVQCMKCQRLCRPGYHQYQQQHVCTYVLSVASKCLYRLQIMAYGLIYYTIVANQYIRC